MGIIRQLVPSLLPLLVFIVLEELFGAFVAMLFGIVCGVIPFVYKWIKNGVADKFLLLDTFLVVILGVVTIVLERIDNVVFEWIAVSAIFSFLLGVSVFTPFNYIQATMQHSLKISLSQWQQQQIIYKVREMFWFTFFYTLLIIVLSFVVGENFYIKICIYLLVATVLSYFICVFVKNKKQMNRLANEEQLPLVDEQGNVIGKAPRSVCHSDNTLLHPVVHLHVFNNKGELYLQKRALTKKIQPGKWDTAVGGHIAYGEQLADALRRETREEIGLIDFMPIPITSYKWQSVVESEMINVFATITDNDLVKQNDEIDDARFWSFDEIRKAIGTNVLTPNFEKEFVSIVDTDDFRRKVFGK